MKNPNSKVHHISSQSKFSHVWREANFVADAIAHVGHSVDTASWIENFPPSVNKAINFDLCNLGCPRGFCL